MEKKLKIIIGSESFAPNISGVATMTALFADYLAESGHEVYVFAPSRTRTTYYDENYQKYKVFRLKSLPNPFRKNFRFAFNHKKDIIREVKKIQPDIIHLQDPTSICSQLLKIGKKLKIPIVITNHFTLDYVLSYARWLKPIHPLLKIFLRRHLSSFYNKCDYITTPTEFAKNLLSGWGIKTPITAISNVIDLNRFSAPQNLSALKLKYHLPQNPIVLYVGRIDKDKRIDVLIRAIPVVLKEINAHFLLVGGGDEAEEVKELARSLGLDEETTFVGWVDNKTDEYVQFFKSAKLFAIPSPIETQSLVTMEALAVGLPVVGTTCGAPLIKDGYNGLLFENGDYVGMAEKILIILKDENLRQKISKNALQFISNYGIDESFQKFTKIYEELAGKTKNN